MTDTLLACYGNAARVVPLTSTDCTNATNLASAVIGKKASFPTGSGSVTLAFAAATTVRALALNGVTLGAGSTHEVQFDLSALTPGGTEVLTATETVSPVPGYGGLCCWDLGQDYEGVRYLTVTVTGIAEIGLVWASPAWELTYGPTSYTEKRKDLSTVTTGELSGVRTAAKRGRQRVASFGIDGIMHDEYEYADTLDLVSGTTEQVLFIWSPPGLGASKGPIMGYLDEVPTMNLSDPARWTAAYQITQAV